MSGAEPLGDKAFDEGVREVSAQEWDRALDSFEVALMAEPDNLRYGSEYRQAAILRAQSLHGGEGKSKDYDRPISFFERLVSSNPTAANAYLNFALAYVDKLPTVDPLGRISAANAALTQFTKSIELRPSWVGYYMRGDSYLFWPKFFDRAKLGVADLQTAIKMQTNGAKKEFQAHAWVALGDGYWKLDQIDKARGTWTEGLKEFPENAALKERLSKGADELKLVIQEALDPRRRVNTNLKELWLNP